MSFCSLILFRESLTRYASRIMTNGMEPEEKSIVENRRNRQTLWGECTEANPKTCC